jgi:hypothetical protein
MSVQYIVWTIGLVQILRFRRKARAAQRRDLLDLSGEIRPAVPVS